MAEGLNRVMLLGNLGFDPELRTTSGGSAVLKLRLATSEKYKDNNGAWQERTEWHRVVVWGKRGEALHRFLRKGSRIFVEGSIRTSSYEDKDGQKKFSTEIMANNVIFADARGGGASDDFGGGEQSSRGGGGGGGRGGGGGGGGRGGPPARQDDGPPPDDFGYGGGGGNDDDIPF